MDKHNISTYLQLSNYYRKEQKKIWRNITAFKKAGLIHREMNGKYLNNSKQGNKDFKGK